VPGKTSMRSELRTRCRLSSGIISKWKPFIQVPTCAARQHSVVSPLLNVRCSICVNLKTSVVQSDKFGHRLLANRAQ